MPGDGAYRALFSGGTGGGSERPAAAAAATATAETDVPLEVVVGVERKSNQLLPSAVGEFCAAA